MMIGIMAVANFTVSFSEVFLANARMSKMLEVDIGECFDKIDIDGSGVLSRSEFMQFALMECGLVDEADLAAINKQFDSIDASGDGEVSKEEIVAKFGKGRQKAADKLNSNPVSRISQKIGICHEVEAHCEQYCQKTGKKLTDDSDKANTTSKGEEQMAPPADESTGAGDNTSKVDADAGKEPAADSIGAAQIKLEKAPLKDNAATTESPRPPEATSTGSKEKAGGASAKQNSKPAAKKNTVSKKTTNDSKTKGSGRSADDANKPPSAK